MIAALKRWIYRMLSQENYLRLLQRSYFFLYGTGLLRLDPNYRYHYGVKRLIRRGDVILDIGANLGYYAIPFARWTGPRGAVHAVEPMEIYNRIFDEKARKYPWITLYPYALGPEDKPVEMVTELQGGYLHTGNPHVSGTRTAESGPRLTFQAQMRRPAELFAGLDRLDYVKCDVEGFEYEVFSGMAELLERFLPTVQVELWPGNEEPMMALFTRLGYRAYRLEKGHLVPYRDSKSEGDVLFISPAKLFQDTLN